MGTTLAYLPALFGSNTTGNPDLLATFYGRGGQAAGSAGRNPIAALASAEANQTQDVKATAAQPAVLRAVNAFKAAVAGAKSVQQLLANPAAMAVLLTANGLGDQIPYKALTQKTLQSNVNDSKSLANTLTDSRWKPVVQTYDFANKGLSVIKQPAVIDTIANAYAEVTWRHSLDAANPGLSNALTFRQTARTISSVDQILGDPVMRAVITTTLGIPKQFAFQNLNAQEHAISTRIDISQFKQPHFVEQFIQRYLIAEQHNTATSNTTAPSVAALAVAAQGLMV